MKKTVTVEVDCVVTCKVECEIELDNGDYEITDYLILDRIEPRDFDVDEATKQIDRYLVEGIHKPEGEEVMEIKQHTMLPPFDYKVRAASVIEIASGMGLDLKDEPVVGELDNRSIGHGSITSFVFTIPPIPPFAVGFDSKPKWARALNIAAMKSGFHVVKRAYETERSQFEPALSVTIDLSKWLGARLPGGLIWDSDIITVKGER